MPALWRILKTSLRSVRNLLKWVLLRPYFGLRTSRPVWLALTRESRRRYAEHPQRFDATQKRIADTLTAEGIALTHLEELFPGQNLLAELRSHIDRLRDQARVGRKKTFLLQLIAEKPIIDLKDPFVRLALNERLLAIVNAYLGMYAEFNFYSLNVTLPMAEGAEAVGSQRWHRDPGVIKLCKMFLYLTDVDASSGPFTYVTQSHDGGRWRKLFPQKHPEGCYPPEGALERTIPSQDILSCRGHAGTIILCDTTGFHKGGYATEKERIMGTAVYTSADSFGIGRQFHLPQDVTTLYPPLNPAARYALKAFH